MSTRVTTTQRIPAQAEVEEEHSIAHHEHNVNVAERAVWLLAGTLLTLLSFRFVLALLGANPANSFANFIYTLSHPFVSPFFNLFNYTYSDGAGRFELFTLAAIAVYGVVAAGIAKLVTLDRW